MIHLTKKRDPDQRPGLPGRNKKGNLSGIKFYTARRWKDKEPYYKKTEVPTKIFAENFEQFQDQAGEGICLLPVVNLSIQKGAEVIRKAIC